MKKIIVFRLSAMGDVALTVPIIKGVLEANEEIEITLLTREFYAPFFYGIPRLRLCHPHLDKEHKGLWGMVKLFFELRKNGTYEAVIDLHGVIRSKILTALFKYSGTPGFTIDKGRKEKQSIIKTKKITFLRHTTQRYLDVFLKAGIKGEIGKAPYLKIDNKAKLSAIHFLEEEGIKKNETTKIGIAPFATHQPKIWGLHNFKALIELINKSHNVDFFLFGGGKAEIEPLEELQKFNNNIHLVAGKMKLAEELALIKSLDFMISMDSSNLHLAALLNIPSISIWGGTHPAFGFSAIGQLEVYHLQIPENSLPCRPCSVFGNKPCIFSSPKCMEMITPKYIYDRLLELELLHNNRQ